MYTYSASRMVCRWEKRSRRYYARARAADVDARECDAMSSTASFSARERMAAGAHAYASGDFAVARALFEDVIADADTEATERARADADAVKAWSNISACACAMGAYDDAQNAAERAIALDGTFAKAHVRRARALMEKREYARARESVKACAALTTTCDDGNDEMRNELQRMLMDIDVCEARGEGEKRKGLHAAMGAAVQPKPVFANAAQKEGNGRKRVSFAPELAMDGVDDDDTSDSTCVSTARVTVTPPSRGLTKPLLQEFGVAAIERAMTTQTATNAGANSAATYEYKRCKMCGNVCHAKMSSCSSCCLPLVAPDSFEPATLPKVGDAAAYETDSDEDGDAEDDNLPTSFDVLANDGHENDPWWVKHFTRAALEAPEYALGLDPALQPSFDALKCPPTADESVIRAAYRDAITVAHPDAGGSTKELYKIHAAYDAISADFWRHDEGAEILRRMRRMPANHDHDADYEYVDVDNEDIFVVLDVYRNREAEHTLKRIFECASKPERVYVGVTWQYKTTAAPPDAAGACVDRLHPELNHITEEVAKNALEIRDPEEQQKYLVKLRRMQLKFQRELDAEEKRCHSRKTLAAPFREHVRETHLAWDTTDGPSYARHIAMRKWAGEKYILHIDAMTALDPGWDDILLDELHRAEAMDAKCVLTAAPLEYNLQSQNVIDENTFEVKYTRPVYGTIEPPMPAIDITSQIADRERAPALTCAHAFGSTALCHMRARQLREPPPGPISTLFMSSNFAFARAQAFVRDGPPDAHAPFLHLGEELSATARLWTRGWNFYAPVRVPVRHCYDGGPRVMWMEDRRRGKMLYDDRKMRWGMAHEWEKREFLNLTSRRRVTSLVGAPDAQSATSRDEPVIFTKTYGVGCERTIEEFSEHVGLDFCNPVLTQRAQCAGRDGKEFRRDAADDESRVPTKWRGSNPWDATVWIGPSEFVG